MTRRYRRWLVVGLLIVAVGGHWIVLQSAAWVGMFASNLATASIKEALNKTFDGQHLCKLCKVVREGKRAEKKQNRQILQTKLDLLLDSRQGIVFRWIPPDCYQDLNMLAVSRSDAPPSPPPRLLHG